MPEVQDAIKFIVFGSFLAIFVWMVKSYINEKTKRHSAKDAILTMGEFEEHCSKMQAACLVHVKLVNIEKRLEAGDATLAKHTETIGKLNIENLGKMIMSTLEINNRTIQMLDVEKVDKDKVANDIKELQKRTEFLKVNREP